MTLGRRLLYLAHGFPPAGGSGPNRALGFARYLPEHGWLATVVTPGGEWASPRDESLLSDVPVGLHVVRTRSWERRAGATGSVAPRVPSRPPSARRAQLGHLARFPDAHRGWIPFAVAAGLAAARRDHAELIYSTAGPFSAHLAGLLLHRLTGLPWLAELRDGWYRWNQAIFPDYPVWRGEAERRLERTVVHQSARVVLVTRLMAEAFRGQYPELPADHFQVVANGFDPAQLRDDALTGPRGGEYRVVYTGTLYRGRSVEPFLDAALSLGRAEPRFRDAFRLVVLGNQDEQAAAELTTHPLAGSVELRGYGDHRSTMAEARSADLLLLLVNTTPGAAAAVPGKLYEYLAARRPILTLAPPGAEAGAIVAEAGAGWVAQADRSDQVEAGLRAAWQAHLRGQLPVPRAEVIARYDRRTLAGDLARLLTSVADAR
ncbi:MAG: glycosyltransferase [Chloroflexi bacterium]|nr:glycosyltransferase [Chloroflexota bacterium]